MQVDLAKLEVAIKYIDRMAEGKNPVKNVDVEDDSVLNNPNVIRCMYFVKEILEAVQENDGVIGGRKAKPSKTPFPYECLSDFQYMEDTSIAHFMAQLKGLARDPNVHGIGTKPVTDWLKAQGYFGQIYGEDATASYRCWHRIRALYARSYIYEWKCISDYYVFSESTGIYCSKSGNNCEGKS